MKEQSLKTNFTIPELKDYQLRHKSSNYNTFFSKFVRKAVGASRFDTFASRTLLRNIATVSDEAFCLLVYENQDDRWTELAKPENKGKKLQIPAKFTSGGGKNIPREGQNRKGKGWSNEGMHRFTELCVQIEHDRANSAERHKFEVDFRLKRREEEKTRKKRASKKKVYPGDQRKLGYIYNEMDKEILIGTSMDSQFLFEDDDDDDDDDDQTNEGAAEPPRAAAAAVGPSGQADTNYGANDQLAGDGTNGIHQV